MGILSTGSDFFGLDIGTSAIRVVQVKGGTTKTLVAYGSMDIDRKLAQTDSNANLQKLGQAIRQLVQDSRISTNNVAVGIPSQKTFMTVVDIEKLEPKELDRTIRLRADSLIPNPLDESKIDWTLLGQSPKDQTKAEILLGSVSNVFVERQLDMLEGIGFNVVAFEPDSLAITRALLPPNTQESRMIVDMGNEATDLVITLNDAPRLIRTIPIGMDAVIRAAIQNLGIDQKQATQFVYKFGLSKDKLEGQIYGAIHSTIDNLVNEIEKSIKFFSTRYKNVPVSGMILTGGASVLPEFPLHIANKFNMNVEIGNAWRNVAFNSSLQNELLAVSNKFSVAVGLAERSGGL